MIVRKVELTKEVRIKRLDAQIKALGAAIDTQSVRLRELKAKQATIQEGIELLRSQQETVIELRQQLRCDRADLAGEHSPPSDVFAVEAIEPSTVEPLTGEV